MNENYLIYDILATIGGVIICCTFLYMAYAIYKQDKQFAVHDEFNNK